MFTSNYTLLKLTCNQTHRAMYEPLGDACPAVRSSSLSVLTHLVLGGRVKAKGSVAKVARLMVDDDAGALFALLYCLYFTLHFLFFTS